MKNNEEHLPLYGVGPIIVYGQFIFTAIAISITRVMKWNFAKVDFLNLPFKVLGVLLIVFGLYLDISAKYKSKLFDKVAKNTLITDGVYAIVRNPVYGGTLLGCTGVVLLTNNLLLLIVPVCCWIYVTIFLIRTEEKWLRDLYGREYEDYCKKVNRCIPWFPKKRMRALFITDLDGTLMRDDKTISPESASIFNRLIQQGVYLTYATARSINSASKITKDIAFDIPVIIRNGTILADPKTGQVLEISIFGKEELEIIKKFLKDIDVPGFVTTYIEGKECKLYLKGRMNAGFEDYLKLHADDTRLRMVDSEDLLYQGQVCYFTLIADQKDLTPLYECVKNNNAFNCIFQKDKYRPEYWLELCPQNATKSSAIKRIQKMYDCEKVVVFGDSLNDISMFQTADECYAVNNAMSELKSIATQTIDDNNSDGVAKWLDKNWQAY